MTHLENDKYQKQLEKDERKYGDPYLKVWAEGDPDLEFFYEGFRDYKKLSDRMFKWALATGLVFIILRILEIWEFWQNVNCLGGAFIWLAITYFLLCESFRYNDKSLLYQFRILDAWKKPKTEKDDQELNKRLLELDEKERKCSK